MEPAADPPAPAGPGPGPASEPVRPPARPNPLRSALIVAAALAVAAVVVAYQVYPPDWALVRVGPLPDGASAVILVAERGGAAYPMSEYRGEILPEPVQPGGGGALAGADRHAVIPARWLSGDRYGLVASHPSGERRLWWLPPGAVRPPSPIRYLIGGRVPATIEVPPGLEHVKVPDDLNERLRQGG